MELTKTFDTLANDHTVYISIHINLYIPDISETAMEVEIEA